MPSAEIRAARPDDARGIAEVHVESWRAIYRDLMPDRVLDDLSVDRRERGWQELLSSPSPSSSVCLVVERGGTIVGFSHTGSPQDEADAEDAAVGELHGIYLRSDVWGTGIGRALMGRVEAELLDTGFTTAILWVVEGNESARRFYEAAGWATDGGTKTECMPGIEAPAVRYRKNLTRS